MLFSLVCHSIYTGGSESWGVLSPGGLHRGGLHPGGVCMGGLGRPPQILWDTVNEPAVHILLECIPVYSNLVLISLTLLDLKLPDDLFATQLKLILHFHHFGQITSTVFTTVLGNSCARFYSKNV